MRFLLGRQSRGTARTAIGFSPYGQWRHPRPRSGTHGCRRNRDPGVRSAATVYALQGRVPMHARNRPGYAPAHHARRSRVRTEDRAGRVAPAMLAPHDREDPRRATGLPALLERRRKRWLAAQAAKVASHIGLVRRIGQGDLPESDCLAQSTPTRSQGRRSGKRAWGHTYADGSAANRSTSRT
jgi:hypothetical protein